MRVFLFCVDALEYDFISPRNYPHLKQEQYEKVHIPLRCMTKKPDGLITPFTPIMWKQILTGRCEADVPTSKPDRYKNTVLNWLLRRKLVRNTYRSIVSTGMAKRGLPLRMGFERKNIMEGEESLLTVAKNPLVLQDPVLAEIRWAGIKTGEFKPFEILEKFEDIFEEEKREALDSIDETWDLFIFYTKLLDTSGHLLWGRDNFMEKYYQRVEDFAGKIRSILSDDTLMVILSDHGMSLLEGSSIGGRHSHHAYMSLSHPAEIPEDFDILHIRDIIEGFMMAPVDAVQ